MTAPLKIHNKLEMLSVSELIPYARNSRTHSEEQINQIAASIREFGFTNPVLIDESTGIIAGHGRVMAARKLGMKEVPCLRLAGITEAQKRAYVIADNKIALNSSWDENMLNMELEWLNDNGIDLDVLGFDEEIDDVIAESKTDSKLDVKKVETAKVDDRFWISIRGPLEKQAYALQRLQELMGEMQLDIELGTVER